VKPSVLFLLLLSCSPGAVGPWYRGQPLFTVNGQVVTSGAVPTRPIRLALAWYPDVQSTTAPRAIVTQDIAYEGSFPLNYAFSFFSVPPPGVLIDYPDGDQVRRAAFGVLMAYEDVNGNGQLDSIPMGGSAVDRVLGTSVGDTYNGKPSAKPVYVAYVEGTPSPRWVGFAPGYNLWRQDEVVPEATNVTIELVATNELNFFVCEEFISGSAYGSNLPCNIAPTGGVRVIGSVYQENEVRGLTLSITNGLQVLPDLQVELNDAGVPFNVQSGLYGGQGFALESPGFNTVTVRPLGEPPLIFSLEMPGRFSLQTPTSGRRLLAGMSLPTSWTSAERASLYQVQANALTPPNEATSSALVRSQGESSFSTTLSGFTRDDTYGVSVSASARRSLVHGRGGSLVSSVLSRLEYVDVLPIDIGLWLEGAVTVSTYQGLTGASVYMQGFEGVTPRTDVLVTANGEPMLWSRAVEAYTGAVDAEPAGMVTLAISSATQPRKAFQVLLPEDFTLTEPPRSHPTHVPLELTWSAAPDASDYRVSVNDPSGRLLYAESLVGTRATVPALDVAGVVTITVAAVKRGANRHLVGAVQKSVDVALTP
jgi:hypothetical protein